MARTDEVTPYYIRSATGETFFVDTLKEALEAFLGDDGYRLTLSSPAQELVLRRTAEWTQAGIGDVPTEGEQEATAHMVWREKK